MLRKMGLQASELFSLFILLKVGEKVTHISFLDAINPTIRRKEDNKMKCPVCINVDLKIAKRTF